MESNNKKYRAAATTSRKLPGRRRKQPVILLYKILKASEALTKRLTPTLGRRTANADIVTKNLNISVFAFII